MKYFKIVPFLIVTLTGAIYIVNIGDTFINWDFTAYGQILLAQDYLQTSIALINDFSGKIVTGYYAPLSSISLMLDKALVGQDQPAPWATNMVNLVFHLINGVLLFFVTGKLTQNRWITWFTMFLFLIHPIQASSVLWFAQRKGLMASMFFLGGVLAYTHWRKGHGPYSLVLVYILFIAGLLSKPTTVVLPAILLAADYLLLFDKNGKNAGADYWKGLLAPTIPMFAIAAGFAWLTAATEQPAQMWAPIYIRPLIAATAIWFYLYKIVSPFNYSPLYSKWNIDPYEPIWIASLLTLIVCLILVIKYRRKVSPVGLWGLAWFILACLPVIGLVKFEFLRLSYVSNHLIYLSIPGAGLAIAAIVGWAYNRTKNRPVGYLVAALAAMYTIVLPIQLIDETRVWRDSVSLWTKASIMNEKAWQTEVFLGHAHMADSAPVHAETAFKRSLERMEKMAEEYETMASSYEKRGWRHTAIQMSLKAESLMKRRAKALYNLGNAYAAQGKVSEAKTAYDQSIKIDPNFSMSHVNLAAMSLQSGNIDKAIGLLNRALELDPKNPDAHHNLGVAQMINGNKEKAKKSFQMEKQLRSVRR